MASKWAQLRVNMDTKPMVTKVTDIEETSPYYFIAKDPSGKILSEGELSRFKLKLPDEYLYSNFKSISYDSTIMTATVQY